MSRRANYDLATNMAYKTHIALNTNTLPVAIIPMIRKIKELRLASYAELCLKNKCDINFLFSLNTSKKGFIIKQSNKAIICFNDKNDYETIRFTLAHELGHFVLRHTDEDDHEVMDKEANCFARNLLCPVPITNAWCIKDIMEFSMLFQVSPPMAAAALKNIESDNYYLSKDLYLKTLDLFKLANATKAI